MEFNVKDVEIILKVLNLDTNDFKKSEKHETVMATSVVI